MTALAAMLQKASLQKKDLELELEELEEAATMVVEEQEGDEKQGASNSAAVSRGDSSSSSSASSDSSSSSSDESEESEAEGQGCTESKQGGGGGETSKDSPLQPRPTSTAASPIPQEPTRAALSAERKVDALPSASGGTTQLIQELGERVVQELKISHGAGCKAERERSQLSTSEAETGATSGRSSSGTFLELSPRRNPLLIVQTEDDPEDSDFLS